MMERKCYLRPECLVLCVEDDGPLLSGSPFDYVESEDYISFVIKGQDAGWNNISSAIFSFPAVIFFALGILGLCAMTIFFKKHDKTDVKNNWTEQLTNCFAQAMILVGVIIACY